MGTKIPSTKFSPAAKHKAPNKNTKKKTEQQNRDRQLELAKRNLRGKLLTETKRELEQRLEADGAKIKTKPSI
jgi:hypothetical protein